MNSDRHYIKDILFGLSVGDALGVPVEFISREKLKKNPVIDMIGYGTYNQPPGTWSDDSSLSFCLTEALINGYDLNRIAENFVKWKSDGYWTPYGKVFDIGITTSIAIEKLSGGVSPLESGENDINSNGNGSLMRILPLIFEIKDKPISERFRIVREVSSITHAHIRSVMACQYYMEFARLFLQNKDKYFIYNELKNMLPNFWKDIRLTQTEISLFEQLIKDDIYKESEDKIKSSGYVLHTLEASIYSIMTTGSYKEAVLKAVNLGEDTDTTGAVTGGLAGLLYGYDSIPSSWIEKLATKEGIKYLIYRFVNNG